MPKLFTLLLIFGCRAVFSQNANTPISSAPKTYPQIVNYFSIVAPIVTISSDPVVYNFDNSSTILFPIGINVLKSDKFGISYEIAPFIRSENGTIKETNILFHPGFIFRYPKAFTITTRMAFETAGRFGATLVFGKVFARTKTNNIFFAVPIPIRFGNDKPASIGFNLQLGITF